MHVGYHRCRRRASRKRRHLHNYRTRHGAAANAAGRNTIAPSGFERPGRPLADFLAALVGGKLLGEVLATAVRAIFINNATLSDLFRRRGATAREMHLEDD